MFPRRIGSKANRIASAITSPSPRQPLLGRQSFHSRSLLVHFERYLFASSSLGAPRFTHSLPSNRLDPFKPSQQQRPFHSSAVKYQENLVPFLLADIGEGITECELIQWFVKEGDKIQQFDKICEVQSDKATVEITSRFDGLVKRLYYQPGQVAKVGAPLIDIASDAQVNDSTRAAVKSPSNAESLSVQQPASNSNFAAVTAPVKQASNRSTGQQNILTTPAVRRIAKENKVDLNSVKGTGKGGRVTKEDVLAFVDGAENSKSGTGVAVPPLSKQFTAQMEQKIVQLTPIQRAMVKSMRRSLTIPHFGFADDISFDHLKLVRSNINQYLASGTDEENSVKKISFMPILIKAFSVALEKYPILNAQYVEPNGTDNSSNGHLLYRPYHNIGVAIDSPNGLVVPNVSKVNHKSILEIAQDLERLVGQAQRGQLPPEAFKETTITISNIGNLGGRNLHPVIPPDTVCIVAIGKSTLLPRFDKNGNVRGEELATVSFSADHRVIDGATVARFFSEWKQLLEQPGRLLLSLK